MIETLHKLPANWNVVKIPEVAFFQEGPGVRKWQFQDTGVKLLNVGNINDGQINLSTTKLFLSEEEAYGKYAHFLVDAGDLLIACSGIVLDNFHNKICFAKEEHLPLCLNTSTMRFKSLNDSVLNLNFFKYYLQTIHFNKQLSRLITGSAQLNFGPSHIKQIDLLLPPLADQQKIAAILDAADSLRQKDQQLVERYTALSQSLFLEMFGDPVTNPKGWKYSLLGDVGNWKSGGTPDRKKLEYYNGDIPWVTSGELNECYLTDTKEHISEVAIQASSAKVIEAGSLLLGMYDTAALKSSITIGKMSCNQAIAYAKLDSEKVNVLFVYYLIQYAKDHYKRLQRGVRQKNLNLSMIKEIEIIYPPISLQNQFAKSNQIIEAQKQQAQQSLEKSEALFNSLLQRAFTGELTAKMVE